MIWVNLAGLLLIGLIIWWFWLYRPASGVAAAPGQMIEVHVRDGVYSPDLIQAGVGKAIALKFIREDEAACAAQVIFPELDTLRELPLNQAVVVRFVPEKQGDYQFHCQMNMYRGIVRVSLGD